MLKKMFKDRTGTNKLKTKNFIFIGFGVDRL